MSVIRKHQHPEWGGHSSGSYRVAEAGGQANDTVARRRPERWILVLDDDRVAGRSVARWARHVTGMRAQLARTVHQAECWLQALPPPTAIISDFELQGGETGVIALERIRSLGFNAPAAIVTGAPELALIALEGKQLEEVIPVFSKSELHGRLREWLEQIELCWALPA